MTIEEILALLTTKFQGARKDGLEQLAAALSLQCSNKEEAQAIVDKLADDQVKGFITNWRKTADAEISKANKTFEASLRDKYNFVEKDAPKPEPTPTPSQEPQGLTLDAISKLIDKRLAGITKTISDDKAAAGYRAKYEGEIKKAGAEGRQFDIMMRNFDRANTFETPEAFDAYLKVGLDDIAALKQEAADKGLSGHGAPMGAVNQDGISQAVASYIAAKNAGNTTAGKQV
jgi:hypothetical protein